MDAFDDFNQKLAHEVISEMAGAFFETRRELEAMVEIFNDFAERCRKKAADVRRRAGFFAYVLTGRDRMAELLRRAGVDDPDPLLASADIDGPHFRGLPSAFTRKGRYAALVEDAYAALRRERNIYMDGHPDDHMNSGEISETTPYYRLLANMSRLINERVRKVNEDMSPGTIMQFVRGFDPAAMDQAKVAGGHIGGYADDMDRKLAYRPVNFEKLNLPRFPEMPPRAAAEKMIREVAGEIFEKRREAALAVLEALK